MAISSKNLYAATTVLLIVLICASGFRREAQFINETNLPIEWESAAKRLAPQNLRIVPSDHGACRLEGIDGSGKVRWHAVFSAWLNPRPVGYAGPIDLVVGLDDSGKITGVSILKHEETPSFAAGISESWFLEQFTGKSAADALEPGKDIDGITRATITVEAVCESLRRSFAAAAHEQTSGAADTVLSGNTFNKVTAKPLAALSAAILSALLQPYITSPLAALIIACSIGFAYPQFLSLAHLRFLMALKPAVPVIIFLAAAGLFAFTTPRGYCRLLCPCGRTQDLLNHLKLYLSKYIKCFDTLSKPATCSFRSAGRALLWGALLLMLVTEHFPFERMEIFSALFLRTFGFWGTLASVATIAGAFLMPRFYCKLLCPLNPLFNDIETTKQFLNKTFRSKHVK